MAKTQQKVRQEAWQFTRRRQQVVPLTEGQLEYTLALRQNCLVFGIGPGGTGKTLLTAYHAARQLALGAVRRMVICRPAIEAAGERLGYLPGAAWDKIHPYMRPALDSLQRVMGKGKVESALKDGSIAAEPLGFFRGRSFDETFMWLDEAQNCSTDQMRMFLTRVGRNSCIAVTGDPSQTDLPESMSGLIPTAKKFYGLPKVGVVYLHNQDIVRSGLARMISDVYESKVGQESDYYDRQTDTLIDVFGSSMLKYTDLEDDFDGEPRQVDFDERAEPIELRAEDVQDETELKLD